MENKTYRIIKSDLIPIIGLRNRVKRINYELPSGISEKDRNKYYNECVKNDLILAAYTAAWSLGTYAGLAALFGKN
jgi:hypothetical protein